MENFDYEKKIYGVEESPRFKLSEPEIAHRLPVEFRSVSGKILDVGCGAGAFTGTIKRKRLDLEIYGVDISKKAIKIARKDFPDIKFSVASAYRLPFPDDFFDATVMNHVLEHLDDPDKALAELGRVLKPRGLFWSITPLEGDRLVLSPSRRLAEKYHGHLQRFSRASLLSLLERNNFMVERYYFWGFLLCQVIGVVYLFLLDLFKLPPHFSVKSYVTREGRAPGRSLLSFLRKFVSFLLNIESLLVPDRFPGYFMHIVARKV